MNQSRQFAISNKIVTSADLRRLAEVFQGQQRLAKESEHHSSLEFAVTFSDGTRVNSDSGDVLDDENLTAFPARPLAVSMRFHNFSLKRSVSLSLAHGESTYDNRVAVDGSEPSWLTVNLDALRRIVDGLRPQESWFRSHPGIIMILSVISYASLIHLFVEIAALVLRNVPFPESLRGLSVIPYWASTVVNVLVGLYWGGQIEGWMLSLWPRVEFAFGLPHLQEEQARRRRVKFMATAVLLPIFVNLITQGIQALNTR